MLVKHFLQPSEQKSYRDDSENPVISNVEYSEIPVAHLNILQSKLQLSDVRAVVGI